MYLSVLLYLKLNVFFSGIYVEGTSSTTTKTKVTLLADSAENSTAEVVPMVDLTDIDDNGKFLSKHFVWKGGFYF